MLAQCLSKENIMMNIFKDMLSGKRPMPNMNWNEAGGAQAPDGLNSQFNSAFSDALTNQEAKQGDRVAQAPVELPRHSGNLDFAPNAMSQSLDNVNTSKGARRNVASDDWFHINSRPNNKTFF